MHMHSFKPSALAPLPRRLRHTLQSGHHAALCSPRIVDPTEEADAPSPGATTIRMSLNVHLATSPEPGS